MSNNYEEYKKVANRLDDKLKRYYDLDITPVFTEHDVNDAIDAINFLVEEAIHYRKEYNANIDDSIKHSKTMIGGMFKLALATEGFTKGIETKK